jgi:protein SCO1/2
MFTLLGSVLLLGSGPARAHGAAHDKHATQPPPSTTGSGSMEVKLLDLELIDQNGLPALFKSDVIGERIVVMNFIYTTCTTVCPVASAIFGQVQKRLGQRLGKDVFMVSVSVDPVRDRPARLKAYAKKQKARPGWTWLTGQKGTVDKVLEGLGAYAPSFEDHPTMVLVGDARTGAWTRFFGFTAPDQIMAEVDKLVAARAHALSAALRQ